MMKGVILAFPQGFKVPQDQGGPGQGKLIGGFGGDPSKSRDDHRDAVQSIGKAPVILLHGNSGAADSGRWHMLDLQQMLLKAGYPRELVWAPSYLGTGTLDLQTPHANNVNEVREFIDNVWTCPCSVDTFPSRSVLFSQSNLLVLGRAQMP